MGEGSRSRLVRADVWRLCLALLACCQAPTRASEPTWQVPAGAGLGWGGLSQFSAVGLDLHPVLSRQPQLAGLANRLCSLPSGLFLNLTSGQSHSEAARPDAQDISFP